MLKKTRWLFLPLLALAPLSSVQASGTREGADEGHDVSIDLITQTASGSMGTARLSPIAAAGEEDEVQDKSIGCSLDVTVSSVLVQCVAFNSRGWLGCISNNKQNLISAVAGMSGDSKITFTVAPDGSCQRILIENNSMYQQKVN